MPTKRRSTSAGVSAVFRPSPSYRTSYQAVDRDFDGHDDLAQETPLTHVYFALDHQAAQIKIGITEDVPRRIKQLSQKRGRELELLGTIRGGYNLERAMHGRFATHRVERHEWYSTEIAADVLRLLQTDGPAPLRRALPDSQDLLSVS